MKQKALIFISMWGVLMAAASCASAQSLPLGASLGASPADGWAMHYRAAVSGNASAAYDFYCKPVSANTYGECEVFESADPSARLIGVEILVDASTYASFSAAEQKLWVSHANAMADFPGFSDSAQSLLMNAFHETYGKLYLFWNPADSVPEGIPSSVSASFPPPASNASAVSTVPSAPASGSRMTLLGPGMRGNAIVALQNILISMKLLAPGMATGFYGQNTAAAVRAFQQANSIRSTGIFGPLTYAKLKAIEGQ